MSELLYGRNVIITAIECGVPLKVLKIAESNQDIIRLVQSKKIPYTIADKGELDKIAPNSQGVTAEISAFPLYGLEEIMKKTNQSLIVALDSLEDPHNLGAILRSCDAAGADGIILPKNRSVRLSSTVAKVSTGAIFSVKCAEVNLAAALKKLKAAGYWIVHPSED
jgi:23S rRNA (guanosine2251-2'-O)-methyltransferase